MQEEKPLNHEVISHLRFCGRFLYHRMGGRPSRGRILTYLEDHPDALQSRLQEFLGIRSASMSEMIINLEADGLVKRTKSKQDGRQIVLNLTQRGHAHAHYFKDEYFKRVDEMTSCLTQEELEELNRMLMKMEEHWQTVDEIPDFPEKDKSK